MISINSNLSSFIIQQNLKSSTLGLNTAIEQMTTGYKINHAKDNAANYSISTNLTSKLSSYQIAQENTAMGLDLITTASDSLSLIDNGLDRLRALAIQASNGTYGDKSLSAINAEVNSIIDEIERNYANTQFNGIDLLKASSGTIKPVTIRDTSAMDSFSNVEETTVINGGTYSINSASDLEKLARMTNAGLVQNAEFVLSGDIDMAAVEDWTPIGNATNKFTGKIDGNGYVIKNFTVNTTGDEIGLFGCTDGIEICNLGMKNVNVTGNLRVAAMIGNATSSVNIDNSYVTGCINSTNNFVGGMIGRSDYSSTVNITDSYVNAEINCGVKTAGGFIGIALGNATIDSCYTMGSYKAPGANLGGFIGQAGYAGATTRIKNSYSASDIESLNGNNAGGLIGSTNGGIFVISKSYTTGDISAGGINAGGLLGNVWENSNASITNSYATGNVSAGTGQVGGLIGRVLNNASSVSITNTYAAGNVSGNDSVGGLIGCIGANVSSISITNSYAAGNVSGNNYVGGLIGLTESSATITNSYATGDVSGNDFIGGLIGLFQNYSTVNINNSAVYGGVAGSTRVGSIVGAVYKGSALYITGCSISSDIASLQVWNKYQASHSVTNSVEAPTVLTNKPSPENLFNYDYEFTYDYEGFADNRIQLQVGLYGNSGSQITLSTSFALKGLKNIRGIGLSDEFNYFELIDLLSSRLAERQTELGAVQNRLESTLESIGGQIENLTSTRSTIRDADISKVSSQYIKMQILQQASATLLATANQTPSIALALI